MSGRTLRLAQLPQQKLTELVTETATETATESTTKAPTEPIVKYAVAELVEAPNVEATNNNGLNQG